MLLMSTLHATLTAMAKRRPYHHGDLRAALLEAAAALIGEVGPSRFTLREVARRAGVSHNAPYRHFQDKDALLSALAGEGFRALTQAMLGAAPPDAAPGDRLREAGLAYIGFALGRPAHFAVMFDLPMAREMAPDDAAAAAEAFGVLVRSIEECQRDGELAPGDTLGRALAAWSLVHGIAKLAVARRLPFRSADELMAFARTTLEAGHAGPRRPARGAPPEP
jgi:AcrR family transcriptional regulator